MQELNKEEKVIGLKQTAKALKDSRIKRVFVARDADTKILSDIFVQCEHQQIEMVFVETMGELGKMCGIDVGAAVAGLLK